MSLFDAKKYCLSFCLDTKRNNPDSYRDKFYPRHFANAQGFSSKNLTSVNCLVSTQAVYFSYSSNFAHCNSNREHDNFKPFRFFFASCCGLNIVKLNSLKRATIHKCTRQTAEGLGLWFFVTFWHQKSDNENWLITDC